MAQHVSAGHSFFALELLSASARGPRQSPEHPGVVLTSHALAP